MVGVSKKMACPVVRLEYDFVVHVGSVFFPEGEYCDMMGCISVFRGIDPGVVLVRTFSGHLPDTCYVKEGKDWRALQAQYDHGGEPPTSDTLIMPLLKKTPSPKMSEPATDKQLAYLAFLGYAGQVPATKGEAGFIINQLKENVS